jgi:excinuclease ABC subunit C
VISSELDGIRGIGPARRQSLLENFGSVAEIAGATVEELISQGHLTKSAAQSVWSHFHPSPAEEQNTSNYH